MSRPRPPPAAARPSAPRTPPPLALALIPSPRRQAGAPRLALRLAEPLGDGVPHGDEQPRRGDAERLRVMSSLVAWELAAEDEDDADAARESEVAARLARLLRRSPRRPTPWRPPARGRFAAGCDTAP
uniref:Uncharacterized protein n=1 Tax=Oryza nivara TaxID=4536 RepID=A0A0E0ILG5_ORYNI